MNSNLATLNDDDFHRVQDLVRAHTGIHMDDSKRQLLSGRLNRRLRALRLSTFGEYCDCLGQPNSAEIQPFINAVTTNLTSFFREQHHFRHLSESVVPLWRARSRQHPVRIWSAGCSTGAEPYSIAITIAEALGDDPGLDWKILATDLDSDVLGLACEGVYSESQVASVPAPLLRKYFQRGTGNNAGSVRVRRSLRERVVYRRMNLMERWPVRGPLDVIFCRNVAIYFDKPTQQDIFSRFSQLLTDDGTLYIGHSETLSGVSDVLHHRGHTTYEKAA